MKKHIAFIIAVFIILGVGIWHFYYKNSLAPNAIAQVHYVCDGGKTIDVSYYSGGPAPTPKPGEPPTPTGSAKVVLSDGRTMSLKQTISADGARYSNGNPMIAGDESFVFWSKGNGALVLEGDNKQTYIGCVAVVSDPGGLPQVYENGALGFSLRYPAGYSLNTSYKYQELGPGKGINGVKFTIPESMAKGTNLSSFDTGVSVEEIPNVQNCDAKLFLYSGATSREITDGGVDYSFASTTGAAAGNRYEEQVWAFPGTNPCVAVRYIIHYGVIENYPPGVVSEFNRADLIKQFDAIRQSLTLAP